MAQKAPALFIGHGSPQNAFENNVYSRTWKEVAKSFPKPEAIIVISAHYTSFTVPHAKATSATHNEAPTTIYDFYGFPEEFYHYKYNAPGAPDLAKRLAENITASKIVLDDAFGLDHGAWSVLAQMYPDADIPVIELSIDEKLSTEEMYALGKELGKLRDEGIMILGSGNIVHNLRALRWGDVTPHEFAQVFDEDIKNALVKNNIDYILNFQNHQFAKLAHPTNDHFLPLLYVLGAAGNSIPEFYCEEIFASSLSMRCVVYR